eukprot:CAMPEP_0182444638 /NCGR_PEP_ID=MMETSP1172-20130603/3029_1 /TAXON_ID=708627 /ORGANISM="Timspurckia oligopyrenoides, Strain CCMP3278" /LENGTH=555 /DNA_ID=CAMNT_0024640247 /DNA_START=241 /DNA_END=1908 /DNA_ORIENTATION=-
MDESRELTYQRLILVASQHFIRSMDTITDQKRFMAAMQCLHFVDYTLSIKAGVHFTLCAGTIAKLGTTKHHNALLPKLDSLELAGCFGMTELGHGSNVMGIETIAVYDKVNRVFDLHTPTNSASKFWIGGAAKHAKVCTVFAQLYTPEEGESEKLRWNGPHVFVVRLRNDDMSVVKGVRIADCGAKMGLQGVDNGQIWFDHCKLPHDALLNRFADVDVNTGRYSSPISNIHSRFGAMIGGLTTGRFLIAAAAVDACKIGLIVTSRYACSRNQFGSKNIIEYVTHQRRIVPAIASTYALEFGMQGLAQIMESKDKESAKLVHVLSCGLKAMATWHRAETLQKCRECCGGMGVLAVNQIGPLLNDMNVDTTFEGDNSVILQQVARAVLTEKGMKKNEMEETGCFTIDDVMKNSLRLLKWREDRLATELLQGGEKMLDANLDHVVALGIAHTERRVLELFDAKVSQCLDPIARNALQQLVWLYGLCCVENHLEFYLARDAIVPAKDSLQIHSQINAICAQISANNGQILLELCNGFGIPEQFITAPIAHDWTLIESKL